MKIKRVENNKALTIENFSIGDTFLFDNKVCMLVDRNGHPFPIDLETGKNITIKKTTKLVKISCEVEYKVV